MTLQNLKDTLKNFKTRLFGYFPSALPVGVTSFKSWADSIIDGYGLAKLADRDSMTFVLANVILSLDTKVAYVSKRSMALRLRKAAANQVASHVFQQIKERQQADAKAAQQKLAEATAPKVASDEQVSDKGI